MPHTLNSDPNPINACMCTGMWIKTGLAAMLTVKTSTGVAPEVNLRNPLHAGNEAHKQGIFPGFQILRQMSPEVQNRGISGPTKRTDVLQRLFKKSQIRQPGMYITDW